MKLAVFLIFLFLIPSLANAGTGTALGYPSGYALSVCTPTSGSCASSGGSGNVGIGTVGLPSVYVGASTLGPAHNLQDLAYCQSNGTNCPGGSGGTVTSIVTTSPITGGTITTTGTIGIGTVSPLVTINGNLGIGTIYPIITAGGNLGINTTGPWNGIPAGLVAVAPITFNPSTGNVGINTTGTWNGNAVTSTSAGIVTTAAQPNITSLGTLTGLTVNGNIGVGTVTATYNIGIGTYGVCTTSGNCPSSGSMVYPGAGIPNSTGSAWGTSYGVTGNGTSVSLTTGAFTSGNLRQSDASSNDQDAGISTKLVKYITWITEGSQGGSQ